MYVLGLLDARVRPFIFLIQRWVHEHSLSPLGKDKLSSTHVTYMALSFLQKLPEPVLPTVDEIYNQLNISNEDRLYQPINLAQIDFHSNNTSSLAELFQQFLVHYISYDLEKYMISLLTTDKIPRANAEDSTICLQNIFVPNDNLSENIDIDQLHTFLGAIQKALNELPYCKSKSSENHRNHPWGLLRLFKHLT